ncbi:MAG: hypothetical protein OXI11_03270 [Gammaproteobacteria bacterium]|nr:hypothetical protein [Gammaproteobacteria bacterium]
MKLQELETGNKVVSEGFEQPNDGLGQRIVVGVADAACRRDDADFA